MSQKKKNDPKHRQKLKPGGIKKKKRNETHWSEAMKQFSENKTKRRGSGKWGEGDE